MREYFSILLFVVQMAWGWRETDVLTFSFLCFHLSCVFTFSGQVWTHKYTFVVCVFLFTFLKVGRKRVASGGGKLLRIYDVIGKKMQSSFFYSGNLVFL